MMAKWPHLFPFRTQKLSTFTATIARHALVKIANCQLFERDSSSLFFLLFGCLFACFLAFALIVIDTLFQNIREIVQIFSPNYNILGAFPFSFIILMIRIIITLMSRFITYKLLRKRRFRIRNK